MVQGHNPGSGNSIEIDDEDLLDIIGGGVTLLGVLETLDGNSKAGAQMIGVGIAAIGGRRVLEDYFESQI